MCLFLLNFYNWMTMAEKFLLIQYCQNVFFFHVSYGSLAPSSPSSFYLLLLFCFIYMQASISEWIIFLRLQHVLYP